MAVTLKIKPNVEAELLARAKARGVTLEQYLLSIVEGVAISDAHDVASAAERAAAFEAWAASHPPSTHLLTDYAVSRDSIYGDRDR